MTRPSPVPNGWRPAARRALGALASAISWVGLVAMATVAYEPMAQQGRYYHHGEMLGFATAFAVAGSIAAIAATAVYGSWRRAVVTGLLIIPLLPLPALEVG